jgi:hypothetical protein
MPEVERTRLVCVPVRVGLLSKGVESEVERTKTEDFCTVKRQQECESEAQKKVNLLLQPLMVKC